MRLGGQESVPPDPTTFTHLLRDAVIADSLLSSLAAGLIDGNATGAVWRPPPGKRGAYLLGRLTSCQGGISVRRLGAARAGEMQITRLLRNEKVTIPEIVSTAAARTSSLVAGRHVLAIQDTTTLRDDGAGHSLNLHVMIAADAGNGAALGLVDAKVLQRDGGLTGTYKQRPYEDKQSRRWRDCAQSAAILGTHGAACVTVVADRESDIYEDFARRPEGVHLLIRAAYDRALVERRFAVQPGSGRAGAGQDGGGPAVTPGPAGAHRAAGLARYAGADHAPARAVQKEDARRWGGRSSAAPC